MSYWLAPPSAARMDGVLTRFDPRYWTVDFPRPMMASLITLAADAMRPWCVFYRQDDLAGLIWESEDRHDHPLLRYETNRDYRNCRLSFGWRPTGLMPLDGPVPATMRLHAGDEDQAADPLIVAAEGAGQAPAFRGLAYVVFEDFALADYGNRIPSLTFEVEADAGAIGVADIAAALGAGVCVGETGPVLAGFAASGDSVRGAIGELIDLTGLSVRDADGVLRIERPEAAPVILLAADELRGRETRSAAASAGAQEVALTYYEPERDYQAGLQRARLGGPAPAARTERVGVPAVLAAGEAKALAEARLAALAAARVEATARFAWRGAAGLVPGDRVSLPGDSRIWRLRRWTMEAMAVRLDLVRDGAGPPIAAADPGRPTSEADAVHGPTLLRLVELPGSGLAAMAAGSAPGWRKAALSVSFDGGASFADIGRTAAPAVLGACLESLPGGQSALIDAESSLLVELAHAGMILLSRDDDALAAGANLALVGDELVQFGRAEPAGPGLYRLSRLLRGRRGSEWAMAGHVTGEGFALIDTAASAPVALPDGLGIGASVRLLASGVGDAGPVEASRIVTGEALRPPAPVHAWWRMDAGGDILLGWTRRSRQGWAWADGMDAPLGEEAEAYRITLSGPDVLRSVDVTSPAWTYDAAARAADGAGPILAEIVQLGSLAPSRPCRLLIP